VVQERSEYDRRSTGVRLSEKGTKLRDRLQSMHKRHAEMLEQTAITDEDLHVANATLGRLERFWTRIPRHKSSSRLIRALAWAASPPHGRARG
jgi:DNA-binding MarR family transcriptional regulator